MNNEIKRLEEQANSWKVESKNLLELIPLQAGSFCADLGCGPRGILDLLSELAGPEGMVTGIDLNRKHLQASTNFANQNQLENVHIVQANLFDIPIKNESFDLTHSRFLFSEVGCDKTILENIIRITKPGGVVISQESDLSTWHCHPPQAAWQELKDILIAFYEFLGRDINAGRRTYNLFKRSGLLSVKSRNTDLNLPINHPYRPGLLHFIESHHASIVEIGIIESEKLKEIIQACQSIVNDPEIEIRSYTLYQVWGRVGEKSEP